MNPESKEITLVKGRCANIIRNIIEKQGGSSVIDTAIDFGEGRASKDELNKAWQKANNIYDTAGIAADAARSALDAAICTGSDTTFLEKAVDIQEAFTEAAGATLAAVELGYCAEYAVSYVVDTVSRMAGKDRMEEEKRNTRKQTADICRKYLPLEIWNQSKL